MPKSKIATKAAGVKVYCQHSKVVDVESLTPNPKNPNTHPKRQIELLAKIIKNQGWRSPIVVSNRSGFIVKGHGRLEAAKLAGLQEVPIDVQNYTTEAAEYADMIADNRIAELAIVDDDLMTELMKSDLFSEIDIELTGFDADSLPDWGSDEEGSSDDDYSKKVKAPVYVPKEDEQPKISEIYDDSKTVKMIQKINKSSVPDHVKEFLRAAAQRHCVFQYDRIAEFYAHAPKEQQELMEESALVIIDFDKAIENGFIKLKDDLAEAYENSN